MNAKYFRTVLLVQQTHHNCEGQKRQQKIALYNGKNNNKEIQRHQKPHKSSQLFL